MAAATATIVAASLKCAMNCFIPAIIFWFSLDEIHHLVSDFSENIIENRQDL